MSLIVDTVQRTIGVFVITPRGRIDSDTYMIFEEKVRPLLKPQTNVIIMDMKDMDYISSAGLGVIFYAKKFIEDNKGTFVILNMKPQIKKVFEIVKVLPNMPIFKSIDEVDNYLDAIQQREIDKQKDTPQF